MNQMSLLLLALFAIILPFTPQSSLSTKPEIHSPLKIAFNITSIANSIQLSNFMMSDIGMFYSVISDKQIDLDERNLINKIKDDQKNTMSSFIDKNASNETIIFANLNYNTTYFIYYFGEAFLTKQYTQIMCISIKTQERQVYVNQFVSSHFDQACTAIITMLFIFSLFLFFKKLEEERILESTIDERLDFYQSQTPKDNNLPKQEVSYLVFILLSILVNPKQSIFSFLGKEFFRKIIQGNIF